MTTTATTASTTSTTSTTGATAAVTPVQDPLSAPFRRAAPPLPTEPVVVVGAGPVGQTTALLLARWGVPVLLLDARPEREPVGSKALCQARDVLDVWESVGAGAVLAGEGVTWTTARTFYRDQEIARWSFVDAGASPLPPYVNIGQDRSEAVLDARIAAAGGIDVRWGCEVVGISEGADPTDPAVTLRVRTAAGEHDLRAPYAVLTTGARSDALREMLGLSFEGTTFEDRFLICDIRTELPGWEDERRFYFDPVWNPGRQVLIHPCPGSVFRVDWQVPGDYDADADAADGGLDRRIRQIVGERPYEVVWRSAYRFHARHVDRMRAGRVLLAGDSAHLVAPFGARGLNTGVLDADNLAWKLAFVLRGWAPETLLDSYDCERMAATAENIEVTSATMDFLVPQDEAGRRRREELLRAAAEDPDAARRIDSGRFAEPFWYTASPLTVPDPARPFGGRPDKGSVPPPQPGVIVPDVPLAPVGAAPSAGRLRELARTGVLVLAGEEVDLEAARAEATAAVAVPRWDAHAGAAAPGPVPVQVHRVGDLDPTGLLARTLGVAADELWVLRPDAYVSSVLRDPGPGDLRDRVRTAIGHQSPTGSRTTGSGTTGS